MIIKEAHSTVLIAADTVTDGADYTMTANWWGDTTVMIYANSIYFLAGLSLALLMTIFV